MKNSTFILISLIYFFILNSSLIGQYVTTVASSSCMIGSSTVHDNGNVYFVEYSPCLSIKVSTPFGSVAYVMPTSKDINYIKYHNDYLYLALYEFYNPTKIIRFNLSNGLIEDYVTNCQAPIGLNFIGDTLFFGEYFSQRIYKVLPGGGSVGSPNVIPIQNNENGIAGPGVRLNGMAILPDGNFVVTTLFGGGKIYKVDRNNGISTLIHTAPTNNLGDIVKNKDGYYYYVGYSSNVIYKVDPEFNSSQIFAGSTAGYEDGDINVAKFNQPMYMSVAPNGDLYVGEYSNQKLRRIYEIIPPITDVINISGSGLFNCPNNGLQFLLSGVTGTGTCTLKVFSNSIAINIVFSGSPPNYLAKNRMIINFSGFQFLNAYLRIPIQYILNIGYSTLYDLQVFQRETVGSGVFNQLNWVVDPTNSSYILITLNGSGELIFGSWGALSPTPVGDENIEIVSDFELYQNYPNPFNPTTTIKFSIREKSFVTLKIYDLLGNEVKTLVNDELDGGNHTIEFKSRDLSSGIYFCQLKVGNRTKTIKITLVK